MDARHSSGVLYICKYFVGKVDRTRTSKVGETEACITMGISRVERAGMPWTGWTDHEHDRKDRHETDRNDKERQRERDVDTGQIA